MPTTTQPPSPITLDAALPILGDLQPRDKSEAFDLLRLAEEHLSPAEFATCCRAFNHDGDTFTFVIKAYCVFGMLWNSPRSPEEVEEWARTLGHEARPGPSTDFPSSSSVEVHWGQSDRFGQKDWARIFTTG